MSNLKDAARKTVVRMFKPRFAPLVEKGSKLQTMRPRPKIMPKVGDLFSGREWLGLPYRSKQRVLWESPVTKVVESCLDKGQLSLGGLQLTREEMERFAVADGFSSYGELVAWFAAEHRIDPLKGVFEGVVIHWSPEAVCPVCKGVSKLPFIEDSKGCQACDLYGTREAWQPLRDLGYIFNREDWGLALWDAAARGESRITLSELLERFQDLGMGEGMIDGAVEEINKLPFITSGEDEDIFYVDSRRVIEKAKS